MRRRPSRPSIAHTTATLLLKAGVPIATVQRLLRHSDPRLTTEIYGHLDVEDMRAGMNRLRFQNLPHGAPVVRSARAAKTKPPEPWISPTTPGASIGRGDRI